MACLFRNFLLALLQPRPAGLEDPPNRSPTDARALRQQQDLMVASLFRNFLLAERILAAANATPVSWPRLPPTHQHPMWQAWDMAAEMCLLQVGLSAL